MNKIPTFDEFSKLYRDITDGDDEIGYQIRKENPHNVIGSYPYIPFHDDDTLYYIFVKMLENKQKSYMPLTLLDVGAGTGRIIHLAKFMGIAAKGIEFHEPYVTTGRKLYGLSEEELIVQDAFTLTPKFLEQFSVIYTYMPLYDSVKMTGLHCHLASNARRGTTLVEMLPSYYPMCHFRTLYNEKRDTIPNWLKWEKSKQFPYEPDFGAITIRYGYEEPMPRYE